MAKPGAAAAAPGGVAACAEPVALTEARRIVMQGAAIIEDAVVDLPDHVPLAWRNQRVRLLYLVELPDCGTAARDRSLSLFRVGAPYVAFGDGQPLHSLLMRSGAAASPADADTRVFNGRIPALLALPAGARHVRVELLTLPYIPMGLGYVHAGPTNDMLPRALADVERVVGHADAAAGVMLVLAAMGLVLWFRRRHDWGFLWMTLACGAWSIRALVYFDNHAHVPPIVFEQFNPFNILLTAVALCAATLATMGPREGDTDAVQEGSDWRRRPRQVLLFALASGAVAFLVAEAVGYGAMLARGYAQAWALALSLATIWWLWSRRVRLGPVHRGAAIAAYVALIGCAVHDMWLVTGTIPATGPSYLFWGFAVVLVVYALISGDYIIRNLNRAETGRQVLEQRFASKSAELETSYRQLRKSEMASALAAARQQERERLLRDMHDGLGAQLMTALRGVERAAMTPQQIAQSLQDGMDELRMLMDSADMGLDLTAALAAWRNRWDSRLGAGGVQLHWHVDDSLDELNLRSDALLQIMRIMQEAATNVVKHAGAGNLHVDARLVGDARRMVLRIVLQDDGRGLPDQIPARVQRGLRNMDHRARQIGASLKLSNAPPPANGCIVELELQTHPALPRHERRRQSRPDDAAMGSRTVS